MNCICKNVSWMANFDNYMWYQLPLPYTYLAIKVFTLNKKKRILLSAYLQKLYLHLMILSSFNAFLFIYYFLIFFSAEPIAHHLFSAFFSLATIWLQWNIKLNHFTHPTYTLINHCNSAIDSAISAKGVMAPFCDFSCNFPRSFSFCSRQHGNAFPENRRAEHCRNSVLFRWRGRWILALASAEHLLLLTMEASHHLRSNTDLCVADICWSSSFVWLRVMEF